MENNPYSKVMSHLISNKSKTDKKNAEMQQIAAQAAQMVMEQIGPVLEQISSQMDAAIMHQMQVDEKQNQIIQALASKLK